MEQAAASRLYDSIHEARPYHNGDFTIWGEKATAVTPYHHSDGVTIFVATSDLNPDDNFLKPPPGPAGAQST